MRAIARFNAGDLVGCLEDGRESLALLPSGEPRFYRVIGSQISAAGLLGQQEVLRSLLPPLLRSQPTPPALGVYAEAVGSVAMMYGLRGLRKAAAQALEHAAAVLAERPDADELPRGALALSHSTLINMLEPDPWQALQLAEFACAAVSKAGNRQLEGLTRVTLGEALYSLGQQQRAETELRTAMELGQKLNEPLVELLAQVTLALGLSAYGPPGAGLEAERLATPALGCAKTGVQPWRARCSFLRRRRNCKVSARVSLSLLPVLRVSDTVVLSVFFAASGSSAGNKTVIF